MSKLVGKILQPIWRLTRGTTLGAMGIVRREPDDVLLVRHGYRPGWHFPGGGVEWNETVETALARELQEEAGVEIAGPVALFGVFANFDAFPGDHILVYLVDRWNQPNIPPANAEIREQRFFNIANLPEDMAEGARRRVDEIYHNQARRPDW